MLTRILNFIRGSGNRHKDASPPVRVDWDAAQRALRQAGGIVVGVDHARPGGDFTVTTRRDGNRIVDFKVDHASDDHSAGIREDLRADSAKSFFANQYPNQGTYPNQGSTWNKWWPKGFVPPINLKPQHKRVPPC